MTRRQDAASVVLPGVAHALGALEHHHDSWEMSSNERLVLLSIGAVETAQTRLTGGERTSLNTARLRAITGLAWEDLAVALTGLLDRGLLITVLLPEQGWSEYRLPPQVLVPDRIGSARWPDGTDGSGPWARV